MSLSDEEVERYARHIVLREVGGVGQAKLRRARVLVVGAGGLGSPVLLYLAAAGVGTIGIADFDTVSLSNLQRQIAHVTGNVGKLKTDSASETILALNPGVRVERRDLHQLAQATAREGHQDLLVRHRAQPHERAEERSRLAARFRHGDRQEAQQQVLLDQGRLRLKDEVEIAGVRRR